MMPVPDDTDHDDTKMSKMKWLSIKYGYIGIYRKLQFLKINWSYS